MSTAIAADNPERAAAAARGLRELHRGELLAEVSAEKRTLAIAGTHGKTTTSSMAAHALLRMGEDPAYLIGGELRTTGRNAAWGDGGVARRRGRRVRPLVPAAVAAALGRHEHRARPPRDVRLAGRRSRRRSASSSPGRDASSSGTAPTRRRSWTASGIGEAAFFRADDVELTPGRLGVHLGGAARAPAACRARTTSLNAAAALTACVMMGLPREDAGRDARGLPWRRAPLRGAGHAPRRARPSSTTTPTTRPRSRRRSPPRGRCEPPPARRRLPAAPVLAHAAARPRVRRGARGRRRRLRPRRSTPRARRRRTSRA